MGPEGAAAHLGGMPQHIRGALADDPAERRLPLRLQPQALLALYPAVHPRRPQDRTCTGQLRPQIGLPVPAHHLAHFPLGLLRDPLHLHHLIHRLRPPPPRQLDRQFALQGDHRQIPAHHVMQITAEPQPFLGDRKPRLGTARRVQLPEHLERPPRGPPYDKAPQTGADHIGTEEQRPSPHLRQQAAQRRQHDAHEPQRRHEPLLGHDEAVAQEERCHRGHRRKRHHGQPVVPAVHHRERHQRAQRDTDDHGQRGRDGRQPTRRRALADVVQQRMPQHLDHDASLHHARPQSDQGQSERRRPVLGGIGDRLEAGEHRQPGNGVQGPAEVRIHLLHPGALPPVRQKPSDHARCPRSHPRRRTLRSSPYAANAAAPSGTTAAQQTPLFLPTPSRRPGA